MWLDVKLLDEWYGNRRLLSGCIYKVSLAVVIYKRTILGLGSSLSMTSWLFWNSFSKLAFPYPYMKDSFSFLGCISAPQIQWDRAKMMLRVYNYWEITYQSKFPSLDRMVLRCFCDLRLLTKHNLSYYCLINDFCIAVSLYNVLISCCCHLFEVTMNSLDSLLHAEKCFWMGFINDSTLWRCSSSDPTCC